MGNFGSKTKINEFQLEKVGFNNLPLEMIQEICINMDTLDLSNFSLTNNTYHSIASPLLKKRKREYYCDLYNKDLLAADTLKKNQKIELFFVSSLFAHKNKIVVYLAKFNIVDGELYPEINYDTSPLEIEEEYEKKKLSCRNVQVKWTTDEMIFASPIKKYVNGFIQNFCYKFGDETISMAMIDEGTFKIKLSNDLIDFIKNQKVRELPIWTKVPSLQSIMYHCYDKKL